MGLGRLGNGIGSFGIGLVSKKWDRLCTARICVFVFVFLCEQVMGCRVGLQSHRGRARPAGTRAAPA